MTFSSFSFTEKKDIIFGELIKKIHDTGRKKFVLQNCNFQMEVSLDQGFLFFRRKLNVGGFLIGRLSFYFL